MRAFLQKMEGLDCVSLGPDMKDIHTSEEVLSIASTERVWNYLVKVLENLKTDHNRINGIFCPEAETCFSSGLFLISEK